MRLHTQNAKTKHLMSPLCYMTSTAVVLPLQVVSVDAIPDGWMGLDNGPASTELIQVTLSLLCRTKHLCFHWDEKSATGHDLFPFRSLIAGMTLAQPVVAPADEIFRRCHTRCAASTPHNAHRFPSVASFFFFRSVCHVTLKPISS